VVYRECSQLVRFCFFMAGLVNPLTWITVSHLSDDDIFGNMANNSILLDLM